MKKDNQEWSGSNRLESDQTLLFRSDSEETVVVRDITGILSTIYYSDLHSLRLWLDSASLSTYQGQSNEE